MEYKPKIVTGRVHDTGWPIDGHVLTFSQWEYDNHESWHLWSWEDADDVAVMETMFRSLVEAGMTSEAWRDNFVAEWQASRWDPPGAFCLDLDKVEVLEVLQEERGAKHERKKR